MKVLWCCKEKLSWGKFFIIYKLVVAVDWWGCWCCWRFSPSLDDVCRARTLVFFAGFSKTARLLVPVRPGPGWIRPWCYCSVCSVEATALSANYSCAVTSETPRGERDWHSCCPWRWRCPWCWLTYAEAPRDSRSLQTRQIAKVVWQSYSFLSWPECWASRCCCC